MNHRPLASRCLLLLPCLLLASAGLPAQAVESATQWTRFRGENGSGTIAQCNVPLPWQKSDVAWDIQVPGKGNGSPIVFGDKVFVMSADPDTAERHLLAYDLKTGNELWRRNYASQPHHLHTRSSYASGTPCANASAVFFTWGSPESVMLVSLSHSGEELWKKDLGPYVSQHGYGASPVLYDNLLVLLNSQCAEELPPGVEPGQSHVQAYDAATGNRVWETSLNTTRACYGVPVRFRDVSGVDALLFNETGNGILAVDLKTGKPLWNNTVFVKRCVSSPIIVGDLAIGTEGSGGGGNILYGVDLKGGHEVKLKMDRSAPYVPTPVAKDDLLFLWGDKGIVSCVKTPSGDMLWSKRIGGNVSSSPVIAGDKLLGIAEDGTVTILAASENFEEFGTVKLDDTTRSTPLLSENYILIRTDSRLICIGKPAT